MRPRHPDWPARLLLGSPRTLRTYSARVRFTARFAARQKKVQKREARWVMSAATNVVQTTLPYADMPIAPLTALISGMMDVLLDGARVHMPSSHTPHTPSLPPHTPRTHPHPCRRACTADGEEEDEEEDEDEDDEDDEDPGDGDGVYGPSVRRTEEDDDNSGGAAGHCATALSRP